jgi:ankyrin repeat protein
MDKKLDINACFNFANTEKDGSYGTSLQIACFLKRVDLAELLLKEGQADPNVLDLKNRNPFHRSTLHAAIQRQNTELVDLLLKSGFDANAAREILQYATSIANTDMLKMLLDASADIDSVVEKEGSAIHVAAVNGHREMLKHLLDRGADPHIKAGPYGTALDAAIVKVNEECVEELLGGRDDSEDLDNIHELG